MFQAVPLPIISSFPLYTQQTPDGGQGNCLKHVEFYSKNKFEKLVHLVGFIIRIYHDAQSPERQIRQYYIWPVISDLSYKEPPAD
jgi:hypothetical protein